jgi:hypothetical protein
MYEVNAAWSARFYIPVISSKVTKWISNKFGIKASVLNIVGEFNHDFKLDIHINNIKKLLPTPWKHSEYALQKSIC